MYDHKIPSVLIPQGDICVPLYIPANSDYVGLLVGAIRSLTYDVHYMRDEARSAVTVREQFLQRTLLPLIDALENGQCGEPHCIDFPSNDPIITYYPQNPFTEPSLVPSGYLTPPFTRWADFIPLVPDWLQDWLAGQLTELTGYEANDIIVDISSLPLQADWNDILSGSMPQISIAVSGVGTMKLHLLNFPLGGRAIITVDTQPNIADIFLGILGQAESSIELNRDLIALPIESNSVIIHEVEINTYGNHTVYITFVPVIDDSSIPINFGGGLRKIELCGFGVSPMIVEDIRLNNCVLEKQENGVWVTVGSINDCVTAITDPIEAQTLINTTNITNNTTNITNNAGDINNLSDSSDSNTYPPAPDVTIEPDRACGSAYKLVSKVRAFIADIEASQSNEPNYETALEQFLNDVNSYIFDVLDAVLSPFYDVTPPTSVLNDYDNQADQMREYLYCNGFDKTSFSSYVRNNLTNGSAIADFIDCIGLYSWSQWIALGSLDLSQDCSGFCASNTWQHTFWFDGDTPNPPAIDRYIGNSPLFIQSDWGALYVDNEGWKDTDDDGSSFGGSSSDARRTVSIETHVPMTLTSIECTVARNALGGDTFGRLRFLKDGTAYYDNNTVGSGTYTYTHTFTNPTTFADGINFDFIIDRATFLNGLKGVGYIRNIVFYGNGLKPSAFVDN